MRDEKFQSNKVELERDLYTYVDAAERMLLVLSPNILASNWVGKELQRSLRFTPVIPILIENMPVPGSPAWNTPIAQTVVEGEYTQLNPAGYSQVLAQLLAWQVVDFRDWRDPSAWAQSLRNLLLRLRRTT
jgi:hypothetical protein